ncbi:MAG: hypothetical protein AVDCRST_MAG12-817, partial [uncultured Rubrobacteraceae bacterium]
PICTECMRQTEVGIKCPDDARLPRGARAGVMKPNQIAKTLLAGVGIAAVGVFVVAFVLFALPFTLLISAAAGYGAGTLIYRAGGRNGGTVAILVSVVAAAIPFIVVLGPGLLEGVVNPIRLVAMVIAMIAAGVANRQI